MPTLVGLLAPSLRRSIVDQTGLQGRYDIDVTYTPEPFSAASLAQRGGTPMPESIPTVPHYLTPWKSNSGLSCSPRKCQYR